MLADWSLQAVADLATKVLGALDNLLAGAVVHEHARASRSYEGWPRLPCSFARAFPFLVFLLSSRPAPWKSMYAYLSAPPRRASSSRQRRFTARTRCAPASAGPTPESGGSAGKLSAANAYSMRRSARNSRRHRFPFWYSRSLIRGAASSAGCPRPRSRSRPRGPNLCSSRRWPRITREDTSSQCWATVVHGHRRRSRSSLTQDGGGEGRLRSMAPGRGGRRRDHLPAGDRVAEDARPCLMICGALVAPPVWAREPAVPPRSWSRAPFQPGQSCQLSQLNGSRPLRGVAPWCSC